MRRAAVPLAVLLGVLTMLAGLGSGTAAAAGSKKLVEGTVYDTTCAVVGECGSPCPPPCGPIPQAGARTDVVCAQTQRLIACPLTEAGSSAAGPDFCLQGLPCGVTYPVYSGEGAVVALRKRGASSFLAKIPVVDGRFRVRLSPGEYVFRPYLPDPQCWTGEPGSLKVTPDLRSPVPATVDVTDSCVAHPDAAR